MRARATEDGLPRYVYFKNGAYYYVEPGTRKWIRLAKDRAEALALHRARLSPRINTKASAMPDALSRATGMRLACILFENAKSGAKARELTFAITKQDVFDLIDAAGGRCMLTGLPFSDEKEPGVRKRLWRPSIDRIDSSRGYEIGNVRLICVAANIALQEHGDAVFEKLAFAYVAKCLKKPSTAIGTPGLDVDPIGVFFSDTPHQPSQLVAGRK